jgi:hypothetical protein
VNVVHETMQLNSDRMLVSYSSGCTNSEMISELAAGLKRRSDVKASQAVYLL